MNERFHFTFVAKIKTIIMLIGFSPISSFGDTWACNPNGLLDHVKKSQLETKDVTGFNKKYLILEQELDKKMNTLKKKWNKSEGETPNSHSSKVEKFYKETPFGAEKMPLGSVIGKDGKPIPQLQNLSEKFGRNFVSEYLAPKKADKELNLEIENEAFNKIFHQVDKSKGQDDEYHDTYYFKDDRLVAIFTTTITNNPNGGKDRKYIITRYDKNCDPKEILRTDTKDANFNRHNIPWRVNGKFCSIFQKTKPITAKTIKTFKDYLDEIDDDDDSEANYKELNADLSEACLKFPREDTSTSRNKKATPSTP